MSISNYVRTNKACFAICEKQRVFPKPQICAKNHNLINLALALYGDTPDVGYQLYKSSDKVIQRAALSGSTIWSDIFEKSWILNDDVLPKLITDWDEDLLQALFGNQHINDDILVDLFERKDTYNSLKMLQ